MRIYCVERNEITKRLGRNVRLDEIVSNCIQFETTKEVYLPFKATCVWNDLAGYEDSYWYGVLVYQELTMEGVEKWYWKLNAMLHNEQILMSQLGNIIHEYRFDYREVLEELLLSFEGFLKSEVFKKSRFIIVNLCEKAERKARVDCWE